MSSEHFRSIEWINAALTVQGLPTSQKLLLVAIASFARGPDGHAYPSLSTLAEIMNVTPRQVSALLSRLKKARHLEVAVGKGRRGSNLYRITGCYPQPRKSCSPIRASGSRQPWNSGAMTRAPDFRLPRKPASTNQGTNNPLNNTGGAAPLPQPYNPQRAIDALPFDGNSGFAIANSGGPSSPIPPDARAKLERLRGDGVYRPGSAAQPGVGSPGQHGTKDQGGADHGRNID